MEDNIINNQNSPIKNEKEVNTEYNSNIMTPDGKAKIHNSNSNKLVPNKLNLNFNSKYDDALLEELYNSRDKSWRNEISSASPYEGNKSKKKKYFSNQNIFMERENNMNKNINNLLNKNEPVKIESTNKENKNEDRFKDFDDILNLEDPKVKKRKYSSEQKIISFERYIKNSKSESDNKSFNDQKRKDSNITNLDVIKEVLEKDDKNKVDQLQENKDKNNLYIKVDKNDDILRNENNFGNNVTKKINFDNIDNSNNFLMNDSKKNYFNSSRTRNSKNNSDINNNYLNENTNTSNENNINKYTGINLEYSEDRRSNDEKLDNVKDEKEENNINDKKDNNNFDKNNDDVQNIPNQDKLEENSIKNNKNMHYIDLVKTPSEKKVNDSYNKNKNYKNYINFPKTNSNTIDYHIENYKTNKLNNRMIDIFSNSKSKEKNKTSSKKGKNINLKKKLIYKSNTIHHIPLNKNFKINSASNSQKNIFDYLLEDDDDNKKTHNNSNDKNRNAIINSLLYNHSTNLNKILKNKMIKSFYPITKEKIINNNNTINYNIKNQKIDRIRNIIRSININKNHTHEHINDFDFDFDFNLKSLEKNRNNFLPEENFLDKYKFRDKILENDKNTNSLFPNYKNYFNNRKYNSNSKLKNKHNHIILKYDNFFFRDTRTDDRTKENQNNLFNAFSTNKNKKRKISLFFKDSYNDDFFQDKTTLNRNKKKNFIDTNKIFDYNKNNSQRGNDNYSFLSSSFLKKYNNSSFNFVGNNKYVNKKKSHFSSTNRYRESNFQKYIESKGTKILSEMDDKFMKQKTSVLPANPFNFF